MTTTKEKLDAVYSGPFVKYFDSIAEAHIKNGHTDKSAKDVAWHAITSATMALDTLSRESNTGHLLTSLGSSTVACQLLRDYLIEHCQDMQENAPQRLAAAAKETAEYARSLGEEAYAEAYDQLADAANAGDVTVVPATLTPEAKPSAKTVH